MRLSPDIPGDLQDALRQMLPQLLIVLVQRAGGELSIPVPEIDGTGGVNLTMEHDPANNAFRFRVVAEQRGRE